MGSTLLLTDFFNFRRKMPEMLFCYYDYLCGLKSFQ